jgi:hypothetical protein
VKFGQSRRRFLKYCTQFGFSCFSLFIWNEHILAKASNENETKKEKESIDLKKRSYCGVPCEYECELFKATKENNIKLKKKVYEKWNWKEKFEIEFDPDKVFCYSCKPKNQIFKLGMENCDVRKCAIENEIESCIQCKNLVLCEKEFWKKWGIFYKHIKECQRQYLTQSGTILIEIKKQSD